MKDVRPTIAFFDSNQIERHQILDGTLHLAFRVACVERKPLLAGPCLTLWVGMVGNANQHGFEGRLVELVVERPIQRFNAHGSTPMVRSIVSLIHAMAVQMSSHCSS